MTHVLTGDGDEAAKQRLLLAIAAESHPDVWLQAARHMMQIAVKPVTDGSLLIRTNTLPKTSARREQIERANNFIRSLWEMTQRSIQQKRGYLAYQNACAQLL